MADSVNVPVMVSPVFNTFEESVDTTPARPEPSPTNTWSMLLKMCVSMCGPGANIEVTPVSAEPSPVWVPLNVLTPPVN